MTGEARTPPRFARRDVAEIVVGACVMAFPTATTGEVWDVGGPPPPRAQALRMHPVEPILREPLPPPVAHRPRHAIPPARRTHLAPDAFLQDTEPRRLYAVPEGHLVCLLPRFPAKRNSWKDRPADPRFVVSRPKLSTLMRNCSV